MVQTWDPSAMNGPFAEFNKTFFWTVAEESDFFFFNLAATQRQA